MPGQMLIYAPSTGEGGELPWCEGYFQDRSLAAGASTVITPIVNGGDSGMVDGDHFVVPRTGKYVLWAGGGYTSVATGELLVFVTIDGVWAAGMESKIQVFAHHYRGNYLPTLTVIRRFEAGDLLYPHIYTSVAQSSINASGSTYKFTFMRLPEEGD